MEIAVAVVMAVIAAALAWPVPRALARAAWPMRAPVAALVLWQVVGLGGGLAMIGALWLAGLALAPAHPVLASLPAIALTLYLVVQLVRTAVAVTAQRRRHLALLDLLTSPHPTRARTRVISDDVPVAYCLPRGSRSVTVLSQGLLDTLDADELVAVIAHERAHVEQRHDLLLLAFRAWRDSLPRFLMAVRAEQEVAALVEMLADDRARREVHDDVLARAILAVGAHGVAAAQSNGEPVAEGSARAHDRFRRLVR